MTSQSSAIKSSAFGCHLGPGARPFARKMQHSGQFVGLMCRCPFHAVRVIRASIAIAAVIAFWMFIYTHFLSSWHLLTVLIVCGGWVYLWFNHNSVITDCQAILCVITVFIRNYEFLL